MWDPSLTWTFGLFSLEVEETSIKNIENSRFAGITTSFLSLARGFKPLREVPTTRSHTLETLEALENPLQKLFRGWDLRRKSGEIESRGQVGGRSRELPQLLGD